MIVLRDEIEIHTTPEEAFDFLIHLDRHYVAWHPDHLSAEWVSGPAGEEGSTLAVNEVLHGEPHRLKLRVTLNRPYRELRYRAGPGVSGAFRIRSRAGGISFTAELAFGWDLPLIGRLLDAIANRFLLDRIEALRGHMQEEGANLKALLESKRKGAASGDIRGTDRLRQ